MGQSLPLPSRRLSESLQSLGRVNRESSESTKPVNVPRRDKEGKEKRDIRSRGLVPHPNDENGDEITNENVGGNQNKTSTSEKDGRMEEEKKVLERRNSGSEVKGHGNGSNVPAVGSFVGAAINEYEFIA